MSDYIGEERASHCNQWKRGLTVRSWAISMTVSAMLMGGEAVALEGELLRIAQIVPDDTLGNERSIVTPGVTVRGGVSDRIDGGAARGANLFHSFSQFNVNDGQRVYFSNPIGVDNILSRVTGNDVSDILGTLGVDGTANLFLLNPNGIIFGPNARLDISGSFVGSTGDRLTFPDGSEFSATHPQAPPLLTVNVPIGLQYGTNLSGDITNAGNLSTGQNLTLSANNLDLQGQLQAGRDLTLQAQDTLRLRDSAAVPLLATSQGRMLVQGDRTVDIFALNHPNSGLFSGGDMVLRSANQVGGDAHYWSGGNFRIEQLDTTPGALFSPNDPVIRANGDVTLAGYTGASLHILAGGSVTIPGAITITGVDVTNALRETVTLSDGSTVAIDGAAQSTLDIRAGVDWSLLGGLPGNTMNGVVNPLPVFQPPPPTGSNITIASILSRTATNSNVLLTNQFAPNLQLQPGNITITGVNTLGNSLSVAGSAAIDARNNIQVATGINTSIVAGTGGNLRLLSGGTIDTLGGELTAGSDNGNGGNITLNAEGNVFTAAVRSFVSPRIDLNTGIGNGGNISIMSRNGSIQVGRANTGVVDVNGFIESASGENGVGNGGNITLNALGDIAILTRATPGSSEAPFSVGSFVGQGGIGNGGNITMTSRAGSINTPFGRTISSTDFGNGGNITYSAANNILLFGAESFSNNAFAGTVDIPFLVGNAGDVSLTSGGDTFIVGAIIDNDPTTALDIAGGQVISEIRGTTLSGTLREAGNVSVRARSLFMLDGAAITASTRTVGDAGNISIVVDDAISLTDSSLIQGLVFPGGVGIGASIGIQARSLSLTGGSQIGTALFRESSGVPGGQGQGGSINIIATDSITLSGIAPAERGSFSSGLLTLSERGTIGPAGNLTVNTGTLRISDGALIAAGAYNGSRGGDVTVTANSVELTNGGQILANTRSSGASGNVLLNVTDTLTIQGRDSNFSNRVAAVAQYILNTRTTAEQQGGTYTDRVDDIIVNLGILSGVYTSASASELAETFEVINGNAGNINIAARTTFMNDSGIIQASTAGNGASGDIRIRTQSLTLRNGAEILALTTAGSGQAGNILIEPLDPNTPSTVIISGTAPAVIDGFPAGASSGLFSASERTALPNGEFISATGSGGFIQVTTDALVVDQGATISARTRTTGAGGDIILDVDTLNLTRGGQILATEFNGGVAGNITVNATGRVNISGFDPTYTTRFNQVVDAYLALDPTGNRQAAIDNARGRIDPNNEASGLQAQSLNSAGRGSGEIRITAGSLFVQSDPTQPTEVNLNTSTFGRGNAGSISIQVDDSVTLDNANVFTTVESGATGNAGRIRIQATSLNLLNGAQIQTLVRGTAFDDNGNGVNPGGRGSAGNIAIIADRNIRLDGTNLSDTFESGIFSQVEAGAIGNAGNVRIVSRGGSLFLLNGARISSSMFGTGRAGSVTVRVPRQIFASGIVRLPTFNRVTQISSQLGTGAIGSGGDINIFARSLSMDNLATLIASTSGRGNAGRINLQINDAITMAGGSTIRALVEQRGVGLGGNVDVRSRSLTMTEGAQISASLFRSEDTTRSREIIPGGVGRAGNITINATDFVNLSGEGLDSNGGRFSTGILASTEAGASGPAGSITINTGRLDITNQAVVVASTRNNSPAGNVTLNVAGRLRLIDGGLVSVQGSDRGTPGSITINADSLDIARSGGRFTGDINTLRGIQASTQRGSEANITLNVSDSVNLRSDGDVAARVLESGTGGNITINAGRFVLALRPENSDILADVERGTGGEVEANAAGVFGFRRGQDGDTRVSDITSRARIGINGTTSINAEEQLEPPDAPVDRIDPADLIAPRCLVDSTNEQGDVGQFVITGRGGLPPNPTEVLGGETVLTPLAIADNTDASLSTQDSALSSPDAIAEAQSWVINAEGQVALVAQTPDSPSLVPPSCTAAHNPS